MDAPGDARWVRGRFGDDHVVDGAAERLVDVEADLHIRPDGLEGGGADEVKMVVLQAFSYHVAGNVEREHPVLQRDGIDVGEPHHDGRLGELGSGSLQDVCPGVLRLALRERYRHAYPQDLSTMVDNFSGE